MALIADDNEDGKLTEAEIAATVKIEIKGEKIADLTGIGFFTELVRLDCSYNALTALDLSKNTKLEWLNCRNNKLTVFSYYTNWVYRDYYHLHLGADRTLDLDTLPGDFDGEKAYYACPCGARFLDADGQMLVTNDAH